MRRADDASAADYHHNANTSAGQILLQWRSSQLLQLSPMIIQAQAQVANRFTTVGTQYESDITLTALRIGKMGELSLGLSRWKK